MTAKSVTPNRSVFVVPDSSDESETESNLTHNNNDEPDSEGQKKQKPSRSAIYEFYTLKDDGKYHCKNCNKKYKNPEDKSTGTLTTHLRRKHPALSKAGKLVLSIQSYLIPDNEKGKPVEFTRDGFMKKLLDFIVIDDQPFTSVEGEGLKQLLKFCNSEAIPPTEGTIRNKITEQFELEKNQLKQLLQETPGKISFVLDGWTSLNQWPFLGIIAQWICAEWDIKSVVIDLKVFEGSHTGKNIASAFLEVLESFGIMHKVNCVTTDNASNMDTFFKTFEKLANERGLKFNREENRVRCLEHIVNLTCNDALRCLPQVSVAEENNHSDDPDLGEISRDERKENDSVAKLRKAIVKLRSSTQRREAFRRQCQAAELNLELIRDVQTRWNSTFDMIVRALKLREPIQCTLIADRELQAFTLSEEDWNQLEYLHDLLEPFKDITEFMSSEKYSAISFCSLVYSTLYEHLEKYVIDEKRNMKAINAKTGEVYPIWIREAAVASIEKLSKYYTSSDGLAYVLGTILDPRLKLDAFKSMTFRQDVITSYKKRCIELWKSHYKPAAVRSETEEPVAKKNKSLFALNISTVTGKKGTEDEFEKYLKEKTVSPDLITSGALGWWKNHQENFPNLSKMAMDYLSISGTGVPVERLFSMGPDLLTHRRLSMSAERIRQCICLKSWRKFNTNQKLDIISAVSDKMLGNVD